MKFDIVRAWKDETYRNSLSTEEQTLLPENPAGAFELSDAELEAIHGATNINGNVSGGCTSDVQWGAAGNAQWAWDGGQQLGNEQAVGSTCV